MSAFIVSNDSTVTNNLATRLVGTTQWVHPLNGRPFIIPGSTRDYGVVNEKGEWLAIGMNKTMPYLPRGGLSAAKQVADTIILDGSEVWIKEYEV